MYIYISKNIINGKSYIGKTVRNLKIRKQEHYSRAKISVDNNYFHNAIRKYGKDNFKWEIICECSSIDELNEKEIYYINLYNTMVPKGYNISTGGNGGDLITNHPNRDIIIEKFRKSHSGDKNGMYGKCHKDETKKKISDANKGRKFTDEQRRKISIANTGRKLSVETRKKISENNKITRQNMDTSGIKNSNVKTYKITYPNGEIKIIKCLKEWCKENNLNYTCACGSINKNKLYNNYKFERI